MKREGLKGHRWGTAALRAVFFALSALCASALALALALAQAPVQPLPPAGEPSVAQLPGGMNAEQQRVVAAVHGVDCIPLDQADNTMTPPRLFGGVVRCLASGDYDHAARLFALAGIYLHFDVARVSDRTASGVAGALPMLATSGASAGQTEGLRQGITKLAHDPAQLSKVCSAVAKIGMPSYYPTYMIAGGMGAFIGEPKGGPLVPNFDAAGTWNKLQASYLKCPSAQGLGQKIKNLLAKIPGVQMNEVAEKIEEIPDPESGLVPFNPAFSPDGRLLAVLSTEGWQKVHILDWKKRQVLQTLDIGRASNAAHVQEPVQFSPDGRLFAVCTSAADHLRVRVWNTSDWSIAKDIVDPGPGSCDAIAFSADSRVLLRVNEQIYLSKRDDIFAYSTDTWQLLWSMNDLQLQPEKLAVSPVGAIVAVAGDHIASNPVAHTGTISPALGLLDLQQGRYVRFLQLGLAQYEPVVSSSWSPDGARSAVLSPTFLQVFDVRSGERLARRQIPNHSAVAVAYSPDGKYLVISGFTGRGTGFGVQTWDGKVDTLLQTISGDAAGIAISRDSRYLAIAKRGRIEIWQFKQANSGDSAQR